MRTPEQVIMDILSELPKSVSAKRAEKMAWDITDALSEEGLLAGEGCWSVEVEHALLPVETVEAYGLTIRLDANGDASEISHPSGLIVYG